jgi:hypothetical protein
MTVLDLFNFFQVLLVHFCSFLCGTFISFSILPVKANYVLFSTIAAEERALNDIIVELHCHYSFSF